MTAVIETMQLQKQAFGAKMWVFPWISNRKRNPQNLKAVQILFTLKNNFIVLISKTARWEKSFWTPDYNIYM